MFTSWDTNEEKNMKGKTHAGIGLITFVALSNKLPGKINLLGIITVFIASLLPDIDHPKSIVNKYILPFKNKTSKVVLYACSGIIILWYDYLYANMPVLKALGIVCMIVALSTHRNGLTHSLAGMILFSFISGYLGNMYDKHYIIYYFMMGYGMHLVCDMATNRGIPLFYPFKNKKIKLPFTYKTSSKTGNIIEEVIMILGLLYVVYRLPSII